MKPTVFRYGLYSAVLITILAAVHLFILDKVLDFEAQEVAGYLTMLIAMVFVFFGIRYYRNNINNGYLSFGQGLKIGVLIVLIPSAAFALFDILYTQVINPEWGDVYFAHAAEKLTKNTPPEKLDAALKDLETQKELWSNPILQFLLMFVTVFIIGFIVSIISSLTLMRKKTPAAIA